MLCLLVRGSDAAVLGSKAVRSSANGAVHIGFPVVASVGGILSAPGLSVEGAVCSERNVVLSQDVRGEEVAWPVLAVRIDEVLLIESGLGLASSSAKAGVVGVLVEEAHAIVGAVLLAVLGDGRCVDSSGKLGWCIEAGYGRSIPADSTLLLRVSCFDVS